MAISKKRKVSEQHLRELWQEFQSVSIISRRIGYTKVGTYRALYRFGIRKQK
jgi:hypothetical protein